MVEITLNNYSSSGVTIFQDKITIEIARKEIIWAKIFSFGSVNLGRLGCAHLLFPL